MKQIDLYTDGGCAPKNPGPGTCAYAIVSEDRLIRYEIYSEQDTTSNIMELTAIIKGMTYCLKHYKDYRINIYTDSKYVQEGITSWVHKWHSNGWKKKGGTSIANIELWKTILELSSKLDITCTWVRSHSGNPWNEFVDKLCEVKPGTAE